MSTAGPLINVTGVSTAAGGFSVDETGASAQLFVEGSEDADTIDINDATSGTNAVLVSGLLNVNFNSGIPYVEVDALAGADTINIEPSTTTNFLVDGGTPIGVQPGDTLNLIHPAGQLYVISPGPTTDSGGMNTSGGYQPVSWIHIETVANTGTGGPAKIDGTNGDDIITVTATGVQSFTVSVNNGLTIAYTNTPDLFIDTLAGNDIVDVKIPATVAGWNVQVFVAGQGPESGAGIGRHDRAGCAEQPGHHLHAELRCQRLARGHQRQLHAADHWRRAVQRHRRNLDDHRDGVRLR